MIPVYRTSKRNTSTTSGLYIGIRRKSYRIIKRNASTGTHIATQAYTAHTL
jgi:hypothetical protein